jgi:hypothetical protein
MIDAHRITRNQDSATLFWHDHESHFSAHRGGGSTSGPVEAFSHELSIPRGGVMACILAQHRANFELWHQEDLARDESATAENIATVKHEIDRLNQNRNDLVEQIDQTLLCSLAAQPDNVPLNSETPGLIIDRLSILSLKIYHTHEEAERETATDNHRARNRNRLAILEEQRSDLAGCLDALWQQVLAGQRRFKLYRQMKMYNDPQLNPVLYQSGMHKRC